MWQNRMNMADMKVNMHAKKFCVKALKSYSCRQTDASETITMCITIMVSKCTKSTLMKTLGKKWVVLVSCV